MSYQSDYYRDYVKKGIRKGCKGLTKDPDYSKNYYLAHSNAKRHDGRTKDPDYRKKRYETLNGKPTRVPQTSEQRREKDRIRWRVCRFLKYHKIPRPVCQICGSEESQAHHPNYEEPFIVNFLCRKCHDKTTWFKAETPEPIDVKRLGQQYVMNKLREA